MSSRTAAFPTCTRKGALEVILIGDTVQAALHGYGPGGVYPPEGYVTGKVFAIEGGNDRHYVEEGDLVYVKCDDDPNFLDVIRRADPDGWNEGCWRNPGERTVVVNTDYLSLISRPR